MSTTFENYKYKVSCHNIVFEFFVLYSIFERVAKERTNSSDNFILEDLFEIIGNNFFNNINYVDYELSKNPPQKSAWKKGKIGWKKFKVESSQDLYKGIKILRNNLFHGTKFDPMNYTNNDEKRNETLLKEGIELLEKILTELNVSI